ncbi:DUF4269 domain-containing protein [Aeromonas enteropelogenes]|uniref:DUF4269 domain-containing protein n=1 Tax=Aeromonas enteropelogenes TaxID=29489 RepID=UPI001CE304D8|nr:DUF4269 domain-containing protein [Aeromonas enteropelogenes]UCA10244.1 DUF4269 domain-containing protein [Aeromonas enteropelogenes]
MPSDLCRPGTDKTAAPAAVFPSTAPNWRHLDYLAHGNPRQRSAHALLSNGLWTRLQELCSDVAMVSTLAIGLDRPGSDLDILCQHPLPAHLAAQLREQGWLASDKGEGIWLLERLFAGPDGHSWPVELYVTSAPVETLNGWRHLTLMAALLAHFGDDFYQAVLRLRLEEGLKGEAAICRLLGLTGDPYEALLTLEGCNLATLRWQRMSDPARPAVVQTPPSPLTSPETAVHCPSPDPTQSTDTPP